MAGPSVTPIRRAHGTRGVVGDQEDHVGRRGDLRQVDREPGCLRDAPLTFEWPHECQGPCAVGLCHRTRSQDTSSLPPNRLHRQGQTSTTERRKAREARCQTARNPERRIMPDSAKSQTAPGAKFQERPVPKSAEGSERRAAPNARANRRDCRRTGRRRQPWPSARSTTRRSREPTDGASLGCVQCETDALMYPQLSCCFSVISRMPSGTVWVPATNMKLLGACPPPGPCGGAGGVWLVSLRPLPPFLW